MIDTLYSDISLWNLGVVTQFYFNSRNFTFTFTTHPLLLLLLLNSLDAFCHRNQDFIVLSAAGNDGLPEETKPGYPSVGNVDTPASSKSAVAVGSHANLGPNALLQTSYNVLSEFSAR